jgi:hypothetical protein
MLKTFVLIATAALGLGFASPFIALGAVSLWQNTAFYAWFLAFPLFVDQLVGPETDAGTLVIAIVAYTIQHLAVFTLLWASSPLARILQDFIARPRHRRSGLVR